MRSISFLSIAAAAVLALSATSVQAQSLGSINTNINALETLDVRVDVGKPITGYIGGGFITSSDAEDPLWGLEAGMAYQGEIPNLNRDFIADVDVNYVPEQYSLPDIWEVDGTLTTSATDWVDVYGGVRYFSANPLEATTGYVGAKAPIQYDRFTVTPDLKIGCNLDSCSDNSLVEYGGSLAFSPENTPFPVTFGVDVYGIHADQVAANYRWALGASAQPDVSSFAMLNGKTVTFQLGASATENEDTLLGIRTKLNF